MGTKLHADASQGSNTLFAVEVNLSKRMFPGVKLEQIGNGKAHISCSFFNYNFFW